MHALDRRPCLNMISCAPPSPPRAWRRCSPERSGSSWCCAGRPSPATRCRMSASPARPARSCSACPPLAGLVGFTLVAGIGMGLFGEKLAARDVAIGMMLSLALGLGLLFLHFYTAAATQADGAPVRQCARRRLVGAPDAGRARRRELHRARDRSCGRSSSLRSKASLRKRAACRSASSRWRFWPSSRSRSPNARRSSACCWCSR